MSVIDDIISTYRFEIADDITLVQIEDSIRYTCTGNYTVKCMYRNPHNTVDVILSFADPEEEIVFKLKYQ